MFKGARCSPEPIFEAFNQPLNGWRVDNANEYARDVRRRLGVQPTAERLAGRQGHGYAYDVARRSFNQPLNNWTISCRCNTHKCLASQTSGTATREEGMLRHLAKFSPFPDYHDPAKDERVGAPATRCPPIVKKLKTTTPPSPAKKKKKKKHGTPPQTRPPPTTHTAPRPPPPARAASPRYKRRQTRKTRTLRERDLETLY